MTPTTRKLLSDLNHFKEDINTLSHSTVFTAEIY